MGEKLFHSLETIPHLKNNVLFDDRNEMTIGRRNLEARRMGYPYIIVLGKKATNDPPLYELNITQNNTQLFLSENELLKFMSKMQ